MVFPPGNFGRGRIDSNSQSKKIKESTATQAKKHATKGRRQQNSKTGVPVVPQKRLMSSKKFLKKEN